MEINFIKGTDIIDNKLEIKYTNKGFPFFFKKNAILRSMRFLRFQNKTQLKIIFLWKLNKIKVYLQVFFFEHENI